jgi:hypothetical protein
MGMTGWLEYFVEGLTNQLTEIREHGSLTIQDFEDLCPEALDLHPPERIYRPLLHWFN